MKNKITISEITKKSPFKVPEGYFEKMQSEIESKIEKELAPKETNKNIFTWKKYALPIAASFAVFLGVYFATSYEQNKNNETQLAKITDKQMVQYLENEDLDLADLTDNMNLNPEEINKILDENTDILSPTINEKELNQLEAKYFN
jgi:hypothetical protein